MVALAGVFAVLVGTAAGSSGAANATPTPKYATSTTKYVSAAVRDALGRSATTADYDRWAFGLDAGFTRAEFAGDLFRQREWAEGVVRAIYDQVLIREPDPGGLRYWTTKVQAGFRSANLATALYASPEFYDGAGGTPKAYVSVIYVSILQRFADDAGKAYWVRKLTEGQPRSVIARSFWLSTESNGRRVDQLHRRFLRRDPDPATRTVWARRLATEDDKVLAAALVASDEYYRRAQLPANTTTSTSTTSSTSTTTSTTSILARP